MRKIALVLLASLAACSLGPPDFEVDGVKFYIDSTAPWLQEPDVPARFHRVMILSAAYWGGDITGMKGWDVKITDQLVDCPPDYRVRYAGCTDAVNHLLTLSTVTSTALEMLPLPHEMGHVFTYDPYHLGGKFRQFPPLWDEIFGLPTTDPTVDPDPSLCAQSASCSQTATNSPTGYSFTWTAQPGIGYLF